MPPTPWLDSTEHVPSGPEAGPLVVLVHGSLDRSASFARVRRRLGDLHTLVYDRRGYHRSRHVLPLHTTFEGHVDDLVAVVDGRPAVVVGHSYGGSIALAAALRDGGPRSILAVGAYEPPYPWRALAGPAAVGGTGGSPPARAPAPSPSATAEAPELAAEHFFRRMVGDAAWDHLPERARAERRADGPALQAELSALRTELPLFDVSGLTVPVVYGVGSRSTDRHRETVAWLLERTPGAELFEIPGARHGAHLSHPGAFADLVRSVVARAGIIP